MKQVTDVLGETVLQTLIWASYRGQRRPWHFLLWAQAAENQDPYHAALAELQTKLLETQTATVLCSTR